MHTLTVEEVVQAGAEFLDGRVPGWEDRIDLDNLNVLDPYECVIGQLFGRWSKGLNTLALDEEEGAQLGFDARGNRTYERLTTEWRDLIKTRRS